MTRSDALLVRAVGEVARRDLMAGEPSDLPGVGSLHVVHRCSRQVYDGRRTVITAPISVVEMTPDLGGISDNVLPRVSVAVDRDLDDVRSSWLGIIDRAIAGEPVPVAGLGTLRFESGVPAFDTHDAVQRAVNARYVGYTDLEISPEGDHIDAVTVDFSSDDQPVYPIWNTQSVPVPSAAPPVVEPPMEEIVLGEDEVHPDDWPEHALSVELPEAASPVYGADEIESSEVSESTAAVESWAPVEPVDATRVDRQAATPPRRGFSFISTLAIVALFGAIIFGLWFFLVRGDRTPAVAEDPSSAGENPVSEIPFVNDGGQPAPETGLDPSVWTRGAIDIAAGGFTIIVTSKESEDEALAVARDFALDGLPVDLLDAVVDGRPWYRVGVGQFASFSLASRALAQHRDSLPAGSWVGPIEQP